jgi:hypothetical protein
MAKKAHQYTVRGVEPRIHRALRAKALARGVSLNQLVVQALEVAAGLGPKEVVHHDLDDLFGTWIQEDSVDRALAEQRVVDLKDWQ